MTLIGEEVFSDPIPEKNHPTKARLRRKPATKFSSTNVAIAPAGVICIADGNGSYYINQYNSKGGTASEFICSFGGSGKEPGQLLNPLGSR